MNHRPFTLGLLAVVLASFFAATPALAGKDHKRGPKFDARPHRIHKAPPRHFHRPPPPPPPRHRHHRSYGGFFLVPPLAYAATTYYVSPSYGFGVREREIIREYYEPRALRGECPSGLYFRSGQCYHEGPRRWAIGEPVPSTVVIEPLPSALLTALPPPPARHRYARVAGDILLLALGTNMVVDALDDLFR